LFSGPIADEDFTKSPKAKEGGQPQPSMKSQYEQWVTFWVIVVVLECVLEKFFAELLFPLDYIPLYIELKLMFFAWLGVPQFLGAAWLWSMALPHYERLDRQHFDTVISVVKMVSPNSRPRDVIKFLPDSVKKLTEVTVEPKRSQTAANTSAANTGTREPANTGTRIPPSAANTGTKEPNGTLPSAEDNSLPNATGQEKWWRDAGLTMQAVKTRARTKAFGEQSVDELYDKRSIGDLKKMAGEIATDKGLDTGDFDDTEDTKLALVAFLVHVKDARESGEEAKKKLEGKTNRELKTLLRERGVAEKAIEDTDAVDDTKAALIDLLCPER